MTLQLKSLRKGFNISLLWKSIAILGQQSIYNEDKLQKWFSTTRNRFLPMLRKITQTLLCTSNGAEFSHRLIFPASDVACGRTHKFVLFFLIYIEFYQYFTNEDIKGVLLFRQIKMLSFLPNTYSSAKFMYEIWLFFKFNV